MTTNSTCHQIGITSNSIVAELELTDFDADRQLLELPGTSLLIFTSTGCASCRWARLHLPGFDLPLARLCWVDAGHNGGLVQRYEVRHLPALFVIRDTQFFGRLDARLNPQDLARALDQALLREAEELP